MATTPARPHIPIELTCLHCQRKNSVAITPMSEGNVACRTELKSAYCKQPWVPELPGTVMAGPFPK